MRTTETLPRGISSPAGGAPGGNGFRTLQALFSRYIWSRWSAFGLARSSQSCSRKVFNFLRCKPTPTHTVHQSPFFTTTYRWETVVYQIWKSWRIMLAMNLPLRAPAPPAPSLAVPAPRSVSGRSRGAASLSRAAQVTEVWWTFWWIFDRKKVCFSLWCSFSWANFVVPFWWTKHQQWNCSAKMVDIRTHFAAIVLVESCWHDFLTKALFICHFFAAMAVEVLRGDKAAPGPRGERGHIVYARGLVRVNWEM